MFKERFAKLRAEHEYSYERLALATGIAQSALNRYEKGASEPTISTVMKIADVFGVSVDYLIGLSDDPTPMLGEENLSDNERDVITLWRQGKQREAAVIILTDNATV